MGVGVSAHRLAGTVAGLGAVGTVASVDLRILHPDLMAELRGVRDPEAHTRANLVALDREVRAAKRLAGGRGLVAVNVMHALREYRDHVLQACRSGADAIVCGAGLPLDLPELTRGFPEVALIPIVSEARALRILLRRWLRLGRPPDAVVIEHPRHAGGHLGATRLLEVDDPRFDFPFVLDEVREVIEKAGLSPDAVPLIVAGGANSHDRVAAAFAIGAAAVQVGTPFAVSAEGDAHDAFKRVLATARPEDVVTFVSTAGLPARAVRTPWLARYLEREEELQARARPGRTRCPEEVQCLKHCGFRDGDPRAGQFCIERRLAAAWRGEVEHGLFFRGRETLPFGEETRPARDLVALLLTGRADAPLPEPPSPPRAA